MLVLVDKNIKIIHHIFMKSSRDLEYNKKDLNQKYTCKYYNFQIKNMLEGINGKLGIT